MRLSSLPKCRDPLSRSATTNMSSTRWSTSSPLCRPIKKGVGACNGHKRTVNGLLSRRWEAQGGTALCKRRHCVDHRRDSGQLL
jgi:hypothetical protein